MYQLSYYFFFLDELPEDFGFVELEELDFLIFSFWLTFTVLAFNPFHFLMSATVQLYFLAIELNVSPFLTTWVIVVVPEDEVVFPLPFDDFPTWAIGAPDR